MIINAVIIMWKSNVKLTLHMSKLAVKLPRVIILVSTKLKQSEMHEEKYI